MGRNFLVRLAFFQVFSYNRDDIKGSVAKARMFEEEMRSIW
jgi:hypothetical protein